MVRRVGREQRRSRLLRHAVARGTRRHADGPMEGHFETPRHPGLVGGVGSGVTGFDLTDIDAGVVNLRVVDHPPRESSEGKTSAKTSNNARVAGAEDDEDDGDDGIWNPKREDDIAEMDEPVDLLVDVEAVVPVLSSRLTRRLRDTRLSLSSPPRRPNGEDVGHARGGGRAQEAARDGAEEAR